MILEKRMVHVKCSKGKPKRAPLHISEYNASAKLMVRHSAQSFSLILDLKLWKVEWGIVNFFLLLTSCMFSHVFHFWSPLSLYLFQCVHNLKLLHISEIPISKNVSSHVFIGMDAVLLLLSIKSLPRLGEN